MQNTSLKLTKSHLVRDGRVQQAVIRNKLQQESNVTDYDLIPRRASFFFYF
jgi:hypothetical protein